MALKPWYKVVTPREDLREGKPLDASEFAVHLDQVRDGRAPGVYTNPELFFQRTYLTQNLAGFSAEVVRRLSGERTETNAVFNMSTQFGGGKTHALTLLYHLAKNGPAANGWAGVDQIRSLAGISTIPQGAVAVFVGTEFDALSGRGGDDGTPLRRTPWGEIAWQLGGAESFAVVAEHDSQGEAPGGDVIRRFLPKDKPSLILMDEMLNYVSRSRKSGIASQLYTFVHNLSEEMRGRTGAVLAVSIPASEGEMTPEDVGDFERLKKLLDRLGKAVVMSAEAETSEIIRRRLFEWDERAISRDGKVLLPKDAIGAASEYADWVAENKQQLPSWFPVDNAREAFAATYPFHPVVLSVFERKWQSLPRFQRTRGVLRLLALWVSRAYSEGYQGAHRDPLITLGTAPLEDSLFRAAVFEQLGEPRLEVAVTTDIVGSKNAHAVRMDAEAVETIRNARLHRKAASAVFFESNGGQGASHAAATMPEIRLAVGEPGLDIGNVETVLEALSDACYYLTVDRNQYRFSLKENLNKRFADRRASVEPKQVDERVKAEVQKVFGADSGVERVFFPERSNQIPDRAALTLVILPPDRGIGDGSTLKNVETTTREYGASARTYKSALIWSVPDDSPMLRDEARKLLAWEGIQEEAGRLGFDDDQRRQVSENVKKAQRDLREAVWRTYKNIVLLGKDNTLRTVDLGLVHSSAAPDLITLILGRLKQEDAVVDGISPNFLVRNWPPAFTEWSTRQVRDAFYAAPQFPRLQKPGVIKETIAKGVTGGVLAYVGKKGSEYEPFRYRGFLEAADVEVSDDVYIITAETADAYLKAKQAPTPPDVPEHPVPQPPVGTPPEQQSAAVTQPPNVGGDEGGKQGELEITQPELPKRLVWTGEVPWQKWTTFYSKVVTKFGSGGGLRLRVTVEVEPQGGITTQKAEETRTALRELGLPDNVTFQ